MKKIIQIILLFIIFFSIYLFYTNYFKKNDQVVDTKKKNFDIKEINKDDNNSIQNLEYEVNIDEKNYYKIVSVNSEIYYKDSYELLKMEKVEGVFFNKLSSYITITSDNAIYNMNNHKTNFINNVRLVYFDNIISGENLILDFEKKEIVISKNVKYVGVYRELFADKIKIDMMSNNVDILMDEPDDEVVVNFKVKNEW
jgi:hypothetical protein